MDTIFNIGGGILVIAMIAYLAWLKNCDKVLRPRSATVEDDTLCETLTLLYDKGLHNIIIPVEGGGNTKYELSFVTLEGDDPSDIICITDKNNLKLSYMAVVTGVDKTIRVDNLENKELFLDHCKWF